MFSNKKDIFTLIGIIFASIGFYVAINEIPAILNCISLVLGWISPLTTGLAIAFVLNVFVRFFEERILKRLKGKKWLRTLSILITIIFLVCLLALLSVFIVPDVKKTLVLLVDVAPVYISGLVERFSSMEIPVAGVAVGDIVQFEKFDSVADIIAQNSINMVGNALIFTTSFASKLFSIVLSFIIAIYTLIYKERISRILVRSLEAFLPEKAAESVLDVASLSYQAFFNFITGQLTEAVIIGTLCYIGMNVFGFPYASTVAMIIGVTALIPIVGAFIGAFVGAFLIVMVSPIKALLFIVFILVLQQIENNFIYPKVVGKSVGLPDMLVLIAVLVGSNIGGLTAVIVSVPVCSVLYTLFMRALRRKESETT
jgi:predicted PurR-regulated permease PerM